jgi:hypothetical protein
VLAGGGVLDPGNNKILLRSPTSRPTLGPVLLSNDNTALQGPGADHSTQSSAEVKNNETIHPILSKHKDY